MIAGRYRLEREVGRGGMGSVWLARDEVLGRPVAAKRVGMAPGGETPDLQRAEREARIAASLNHPHVVAVFDLVTEDDQQWLVMEYVEGRSLADLLRTEGPLEPRRAASVLAQVADALDAAHGVGIVHRDVKPSNILLSAGDRAKLTDFGIARAQADVTLTQTGMVTGSPAYLAPEIASGGHATQAGDVWSVGATLFHALTGRTPYETGENVVGTLYQIVHGEPPRLAEGHPYAHVVAATMVREPGERWSMSRVRDALRATPGPPPTADLAADPEATQAMTAVGAPAPLVAPPVEPVELVEPADSPATAATAAQEPDRTTGTPSRSRRLPAVLALLAVLAVVGVVLAAVLIPRDDEPTDRADQAGESSAPTSAPTTEPSDPGTTTDPEDGETDRSETEEQLRTFVASYLSEVTSDRRAAFQRLTPAFQDASGGFTGYAGFWRTIESAEVGRIQVDPETLQVSYRVRYQTTAGRELVDDVVLQLVRMDDQYLIDGEP